MKKNCYIKMNYNVYLQLVWLRIYSYLWCGHQCCYI